MASRAPRVDRERDAAGVDGLQAVERQLAGNDLHRMSTEVSSGSKGGLLDSGEGGARVGVHSLLGAACSVERGGPLFLQEAKLAHRVIALAPGARFVRSGAAAAAAAASSSPALISPT